jgi:uncharacterized RDD family membrane protein YckC
MSEQELATRGQRLCAVIIDGLITGLATIVIMMVLLPLVGSDIETFGSSFTSTLIATALNVGLFMLVNGKLLSTQGQTVGKKLMGIKIVSLAGGILPLNDIIVRRYGPPMAANLIPLIGSIFCLADVLCIFRNDRRCIHDMIAGTRVVKA